MQQELRTSNTPQSLVRPMQSVLWWGLGAGAVALRPGDGLIGYLVAGLPGAVGWTARGGHRVAFFTVTVVLALVTARFNPTLLGIVVMVSWLVKMGLLVVILVFLRSADFYSRPVFFISLLVSTFGYLGMEAWIVSKTKVLYLETEFAPNTPHVLGHRPRLCGGRSNPLCYFDRDVEPVRSGVDRGWAHRPRGRTDGS